MNPKGPPSKKRPPLAARLLRAGLAGLVTAATMAGAASGCLDRPVAQQEPTTTNIFVESFSNTVIDKIDLLFMIDNSISMADKQEFFADAVPQLVNRLVDPICVPSQGGGGTDGCPAGQEREFNAIDNINIGIVSSSLGGQPQDGQSSGTISGVCADEELTKNDLGHLIGSLRGGVATYNNLGFLAWDPDNLRGGQANPTALIGDFQALVTATGEQGCGFEATLEAWYRFLIDPFPAQGLVTAGGFVDYQRNPDGTPVVDEVVLAQRAEFLRPDSLVAIIMLSDENDCSIRVPGLGWAVTQSSRMFASTSACDTEPNSACCRSCGLQEASPPAGCTALAADPACSATRLSLQDDHPNVRCFDQKRRFGLDLLFPTARYSVGLKKATLCPFSPYGDGDCECEMARATNPNAACEPGPSYPNPLYSGTGSSGLIRDPSLVYVAGIVGVPWQDIATDATRDAEGQLQYKTAEQLTEEGIWDVILGNPATGAPPSDAFMRESTQPRSGTNPITGHNIAPPEAAQWANPINSHEYVVPNNGDLQFACVFPLPQSKDCPTVSAAGGGCDCDDEAVANLNPLCQSGAGYSTTQVLAKAYPGLRELDVLKQYGRNSIVASICPKVTTGDVNAASYGYNPAVAAIIDRLKEALGGRCLPRELVPDDDGAVPCKIVEAVAPHPTNGCRPCEEFPARQDPRQPGSEGEPLVRPVLELLEDEERCSADGSGGRPRCADMCLCQILQPKGDELAACQQSTSDTGFAGFCYVDPEAVPTSNPELVASCPASQRRILRFGANTPQPGATTFIACAGATFRTNDSPAPMPEPQP